VIRRGHATEHEQIRVARLATIVFGAAAVVLGILFKGQNVAFMVGLAFAIACSANFPALLLSIVWRRFNTAGAVAGIATGSALSVVLIVISPTVWVDLFGYESAIFPLRNPAIVSMPAAFLAAAAASLATGEPAALEKFDDEKLRTYLGVGAE
jgi:cation/acetate symporter